MDQDFNHWNKVINLAPDTFDQEQKVFFALESIPKAFEPHMPDRIRWVNFTSGSRGNLVTRSTNRHPFSTEDGQVGLGPHNAAARDIVIVLFGSRFPLFCARKAHIINSLAMRIPKGRCRERL
jgi:hypothetical protein